MRFRALAPHYQRYSSTTNQSDRQSGVPPPRLCPACRQLLAESNWLSQVPTSTVRSPATDLDPGTFQYAHLTFFFRVSLFRLQRNETLGLRATWNISGLNTFTCVVADFLLNSGFMQSVTVQHAEFCTELVVNLYSGWIVQLVNASFAWRTHFYSLYYSFYSTKYKLPIIIY